MRTMRKYLCILCGSIPAVKFSTYNNLFEEGADSKNVIYFTMKSMKVLLYLLHALLLKKFHITKLFNPCLNNFTLNLISKPCAALV